MEHSVVTTGGSRLAVRQSKTTGEPLLMLHGGPGVPDGMQASIAPLLPEMRCISFDQRGVGESECLDGRYDLGAYVDDIEAVRTDLGVADWHVLGHSWGGLLAQAYAATRPRVVRSLVLSSSSLGVGNDWKRTKQEAFRTDRARAGFWGTLRFLTYGAGIYLPGPLRAPAMRHVMTETWHNYFLDPHTAPDPDSGWLAGCSAEAMLKTDRALTKQDPEVLDGLRDYSGPALVLYGAYDIFGDATGIVRTRFPKASQVTLPDSGHLHWIQNSAGYSEALHAFYGTLRAASG
jgi:proline iminopeptidase